MAHRRAVKKGKKKVTIQRPDGSVVVRATTGHDPHTPQVWESVRADYITGPISQTVSQLAKRYQMNFNTLMGRAEAEHWNDARAEYQRRVLRLVANSPHAVGVSITEVQTAAAQCVDEVVAYLSEVKLSGDRLSLNAHEKLSRALSEYLRIIGVSAETVQKIGQGAETPDLADLSPEDAASEGRELDGLLLPAYRPKTRAQVRDE